MVAYEGKLTPHKTYMSVRQAYEKNCKVSLTRGFFIKNGYIFLDHPVLSFFETIPKLNRQKQH